MPDMVPGPIDDLAIIIFLAFNNPSIRGFLGDAIRTLITMAGLFWVVMPDLMPGPVDDTLIILLIFWMFSNAKKSR